MLKEFISNRYFISEDEKFSIQILDSRSLFTEIKFDREKFRDNRNSSILLVKQIARYAMD